MEFCVITTQESSLNWARKIPVPCPGSLPAVQMKQLDWQGCGNRRQHQDGWKQLQQSTDPDPRRDWVEPGGRKGHEEVRRASSQRDPPGIPASTTLEGDSPSCSPAEAATSRMCSTASPLCPCCGTSGFRYPGREEIKNKERRKKKKGKRQTRYHVPIPACPKLLLALLHCMHTHPYWGPQAATNATSSQHIWLLFAA